MTIIYSKTLKSTKINNNITCCTKERKNGSQGNPRVATVPLFGAHVFGRYETVQGFLEASGRLDLETDA